jgi:plastocyanin
MTTCPITAYTIGGCVLVTALIWYMYGNNMSRGTAELFSTNDTRVLNRKPTYWWKRGDAHEILISDSSFSPSYLTIKKGDTVVWKNNDTSVSHMVRSHTGLFQSKDLSHGDTFSHTFHSNGVFDYLLGDKPQRIGAIRVTGSTQY